MKLTLPGAAGTAIGPTYLIEYGRRRILIDCGLFQGYKNLRQLNCQPPPFDLAELDAMVLTHAHLEHSDALPPLPASGHVLTHRK